MTFKGLFKALLGLMGARLLGAGLGLLTQLTLTHVLPPSEVATVLLSMSAAAFIALLISGGHTQLASTHLPKLNALNHPKAILALHGATLRDSVLAFFVVAIVAAAMLLFGDFGASIKMALVVGLICAPLSAIMRYNSIVANSLKWFPLSYVPDFIVRPLLFLLCIAPLVFVPADTRLTWVLVAFAVLVWVVTFGQAAMMQGQALRLRHWLTSRPSYVKAMRPKAWALFVVSLFVFASADVVMLLAGMMLPPADVAVVGITVRLAALAGFMLQAAQLFVMPDYAKAVVDADVQATRTVLLRVNLTTIAASIAAIICAIILGEFALSLFGSDYVAGATLLILLLVGQMVRALAGLNQSLLSLKGHQLRSTMSCIIALVFLVTTMVLFTRQWGVIGVGYAVIASECAWALSLAAQAQSLCHQRADLFWLVMNGRGKVSGH